MKIVHVSIYPPQGEKHSSTGGVASYTKNLATNIPYDKEDEEFVLCNILNKSEVYSEEGVVVNRCFNIGIRSLFQIYKEIKKIKPDIVHIQQELNLYGGVVTAYLFQWLVFFLRSYKTIVTLHGVVSLKKVNKDFIKENNSSLPAWFVKMAFRIIYRPICYFSKKIIVHDIYFKDILINEYGVEKNKIEVIFHGVEDLKMIDKSEACEKLNIDPKRDICLFMGYLTGYKGLDLLIEGFAEYCKINKTVFLIIGAGKHPKLFNNKVYLKEYSRLENKAKELVPVNNYRWVGFIKGSDIVNYYSASDVSIYPYAIQMSSSGPMSIAMGYEKPFLVSNVFENFNDNKDILFDRNKESLSSSINKFFNDKLDAINYVKRSKRDRLWKSIGSKTFLLYE